MSSIISFPVISSPTQGLRRQLPFSSSSQPPLFIRKKVDKFLCCSSEEKVDYQVLSAINTSYNDILILDSPQSRMLLLDPTNNIHSIYIKGDDAWTGSYWDEFASLPPIVPPGPIAIFGLGGGTAAHLMLTLWPSLQLHGWEIDEILIDRAREHLGLAHLEKHTQGGGLLTVHIGDALSAATAVSGGYAGIVIDLFSGGEVLSQLQEVQTWLDINDKLMPNGRIMVNCGAGSCGDSVWDQNSTLKTLCQAFPGQVNWKKMPKSEGENYLALTGPLPDLTQWAAALPDRLGSGVVQWACCDALPSADSVDVNTNV
ncbi:putative S-adenosyl-L-methionine-dependent methyltransferase [Helianthus annuus]|nr:putative S-adenosyl-L-methionine-dependent methyltransferase [Helianthus annuus]KAJ0938150.1 putative S-adenosyl-L-methionine-dependent methyltransferase [Helianthus annuus]KAJ0946050.1 putative S-adenosyl-L-methionine-dependent methyltransferase [Helianthus annuus]